MTKNVQMTIELHSFHIVARLCSKSKLGFSSTWSENFQMYKLDLVKAEELEIKLSIYADNRKSKGIPKEHLLLLQWEYQITLPAFWETCIQVKRQQLELDMEQWTGSKIGKKYIIKAVYFHPVYLINMQGTSYKILGWMTYKIESRLLGEISIIY